MSKDKLLKEYADKMLLVVQSSDRDMTKNLLKEADEVLSKIHERFKFKEVSEKSF